MGKKNRPYDGPRMSLGEKEAYLNSQSDRYGINDSDYYDDEGNANDKNKSADIMKAMNNDYDLRSSQQYGKDAGLKGFKDLGNGLGNLHNAVNTHRAVVKHGYEEMGHKNVSSNNDYANITNDLFNKSRDKFAEQFDSKDNMSADSQLNESKKSFNGDYQPSDNLKEARERVMNYENKYSGT